MSVVSDTTAITTLLKTGNINLLESLFGTVVVPRAVADELLSYHQALPSFVKVKDLAKPEKRLQQVESLGRGEAEAIRLAKEVQADWLLIDDRKGRRVAEDLNLRCLGLVGIVLQGRRLGR